MKLSISVEDTMPPRPKRTGGGRSSELLDAIRLLPAPTGDLETRKNIRVDKPADVTFTDFVQRTRTAVAREGALPWRVQVIPYPDSNLVRIARLTAAEAQQTEEIRNKRAATRAANKAEKAGA